MNWDNFRIFGFKRQLFRLFVLFSLVFSVSSMSVADAASKSKVLGQFGQWKAVQATENGKKICYMVGAPTTKKGKYLKRGQVYALVTHRPANKSFDVVSFHYGYPFKSGAEAKLIVQGKKKETATLFTEGETAWAYDEKADRRIATLLTKGNKLVLRGTSARGTKTEDVYSLKGSTKAYRAICRACGVKR